MGRACAQDPQGWKRPWGCAGWGLGSMEQKGPRHAPHPWSQRRGDLSWEPSRLPGLEWVGQMPPLLPEGPCCLPGLPPMPSGPTWPGGGFGGQGTGLGAQQAHWARVGGAIPSPPHDSSPAPLEGPSHLPFLISPGFRGTDPL